MTCKIMKSFIAAALAWHAEMDGLRIKRVKMQPIQTLTMKRMDFSTGTGINNTGGSSPQTGEPALNWNLKDCKGYEKLAEDDQAVVMQHVGAIVDVHAFLRDDYLETRKELANGAMRGDQGSGKQKHGARWAAAKELLQKKSDIVKALASRLTRVDEYSDEWIDFELGFKDISYIKNDNCFVDAYRRACLFGDDSKVVENFLKNVAKSVPAVSQQPLVVDEKREPNLCGLPPEEYARAVLRKVGDDLAKIEDTLHDLKKVPHSARTDRNKCLIYDLSRLKEELEGPPSEAQIAAKRRQDYRDQQRKQQAHVKMNQAEQKHLKSFNALGGANPTSNPLANQSKQPRKAGPHPMLGLDKKYAPHNPSQPSHLGFRDRVFRKPVEGKQKSNQKQTFLRLDR